MLARTGAMRPGHAPTFAQFAPDLLEFCASPNAGPHGPNSPGTVALKKTALRLHLLPAFGSLRMDQLTTRDVDNYVNTKHKYPADFDLTSQQPTVWVRRTWTKKYGYGPPKGGKDRVVPVVPELAAEIDALLCERGLSSKSTTEHPFSANGSRPYEHKHVLELVKKTGELAGTQPTHTHMLRHTFGTECARRGIPLLTIKEWMGHKDVEVTMRYLHLLAPDHLRWADLLR